MSLPYHMSYARELIPYFYDKNYTAERILYLGRRTPNLDLLYNHDTENKVTPAMMAICKAGERSTSLPTIEKFFNTCLTIIREQRSRAIHHSYYGATLLYWTIHSIHVYPECIPILQKIAHSIIHYSITPKEFATRNIENKKTTALYWAFFLISIHNEEPSEMSPLIKKCLRGIIIRILNKCSLNKWDISTSIQPLPRTTRTTHDYRIKSVDRLCSPEILVHITKTILSSH